jgi:deazaflavin-dependent oxidoreductase (nitroreductase family)
MTAQPQQVSTPRRGFIRLFWLLHRAAYRVTGGRFGLQRPAPNQRFGMMRLATVGRRSGKPRLAIIGYYEDGPNLVTLAMNGWGETDPAWWLNLQATPDTVVGLSDGPRAVRARAAEGPERDRLWARFREFPGWGDDVDALAARRPTETAVVVLEPRPAGGDGVTDPPGVPGVDRAERADPASTAALAAPGDADRRRRLRLRHVWIIPGLAVAFYANGEAQRLGVGILPLLAFGIAPDLPRLLGVGQPHAAGQMAARALPAFNLMHHPLPPLALLALAAVGALPPVLYVGALAWLGHLVLGFGIGDRRRGRDGFLRPLPAIRRRAAGAARPAEGAA